MANNFTQPRPPRCENSRFKLGVIMTKTVVVTGSSGFVGKVLVEKLSVQGFKVIALDLVDPQVQGVKFLKCDLRNSLRDLESEIPRESIFVHLAALSTDTQCKNEPLKALDVNLLGTQKALDLAKVIGISHFIFASSEWVYPERESIELQSETDTLNLSDLNSLYAMTKLMAENLIRINQLTSSTILRFGIVYGPREIPGSAPESIAIKTALKEDIELGSTETARRFVYIDDLVAAIICCIKKKPNYQYDTFNVSGATLSSLEDIVETVKKITSSSSKIHSKNLTPSIRNPIPTKFEEIFGETPKTSIAVGLSKCLEFMQKANKF